ncbi:MAG: hypothetical protein GXP06_10360 [Alphaproteobacteria bacterium]|nr:hypothetical protein [Alphaproteobacteria bacterium]
MRKLTTTIAAAIGAAMLLAAPSASAGIIGVTVDPGDNSVVGQTEFRAALGGVAVKYFIPLSDNSGVYGVDNGGNFGLVSDSGNGGGTLSMYLLFEPINIGAQYVLDILFEDLDLIGANDPVGFLESVEVLSADGLTSLSGGTITNVGGLINGNANTQQLLSLFLGTITSDPFLVRLDFVASFITNGNNSAEYLIAEITEVPIPAAVWLFFSGIAGLGFAGRSKKKIA